MSNDHDTTTQALLDELAELRSRLAHLESTVRSRLDREQSTTPLESSLDISSIGSSETATSTTTSRRHLLRIAGATAVGAAVATGASAQLAAADGGLTVTGNPNTSLVPIRANYTGTGTGLSGYVFQSGTTYATNFDTHSNAALAGWASSGGANRDGVFGYTDKSEGYGVYGFTGIGAGLGGSGVVGARLHGDRAALRLDSTGLAAPQSIPGASTLGMIQADDAGSIWVCVVAGNPGTWRKLGGGGAAGAFHAVTPGRVYDSRVGPGAGTLVPGADRLVSVADRRELGTGTVAVANFVPAGATAVTCNVTVVNTVGAGYLAVNPGGVSVVTAAANNWYASGQINNNGVTLTLDNNRQVTLIAGGGGTTDVILDVTGYYL